MTSIPQLPIAHCSETSSLPSPCSLSSDTLVFLQPARSAPSLGPPASDPLPLVTVWPLPSCHSDPVRQQLLREAARMSAHLSLSHPPHKNRSLVRAGPYPPAAQAPTRIRHIETWAGRPATADTSREDVSDPGGRLPNLASGVNGRCPFGKLCIQSPGYQQILESLMSK